MDLSGLFILADDIEFIPVDLVSEITKKGFVHNDDDMLITQVNGRTKSKLISKDLATILQEFRLPRSLAEVISSFAGSQKKDAQEVAEAVFGSFIDMTKWGFIHPFKNNEATLKRSSLRENENLHGYTVKDICRNVSDTEVYKVINAAGDELALKLIPPGNENLTKALFDNEIFILQRLDGIVNPKLVEHGKDNNFLITSWFAGVSCLEEADKYRNTQVRDNFIHLLDLCISIVKAYQWLHAQKILHGDVNADNILISPSGAVMIIDYGYAIYEGNTESVVRGGTGFYYEPEYAVSYLEGTGPSPLTEKAEQYSIAVLLFYLLADHHCFDYSWETDKFFRQIAYDEPLSFKHFDLQYPDELDRVMKIALQKDPAKRFTTLAEFISALTAVRNGVFETSRFYIHNKQDTDRHFLNFVLEKFGIDSLLLENGLSLAPTCSFQYGAAGIAYLFYRASCIQSNPALSAVADLWIDRALAYVNDPDQAFYSPGLELNEKLAGKNSVYHSASGVHLVQALISNSRNDWQSFSNGINSFLSVANLQTDKIDVTLGKSGLLIGCSLLYKELRSNKDYPATAIINFAESAKNEIWVLLDECPAINTFNSINYYGIAHGWAGFLYATLLWCDAAGTDLPVSFMKRVEELISSAIVEDQTIQWPYTENDKSSWPGWCNGNAGHIFLWTLLYKYFKDTKYIRIAEKTAAHLIVEPLLNNADLCCGMSGIAYSMINLYNATNEEKYLKHAQYIKQIILEKWPAMAMRNNSLYKGEVGIALLLCELDNPALARMPLFE